MADPRPIGIFDSGIGGLTVLRAVAARLPGERLVYLGDTARVPYGTKSAATVSRYSLQCASYLCELDIKALVVACNTASALAMEDLRAMLAPRGISVLGVIEPGAVEACRLSRLGRVGVIGTSSTIRSGAYERAIGTIQPDFSVASIACPLFVPLAEEGWTDADDTVVLGIAMRYLGPLAAGRADTLIMGCTHYPLLRPVIQAALRELGPVGPDSPEIALVDSGTAVAHDLARTLARLGIGAEAHVSAAPDATPLGGAPRGSSPPAPGSLRAKYYVTDDPERFRTVGARFLGHDIDGPAMADLTELVPQAARGGHDAHHPGDGP